MIRGMRFVCARRKRKLQRRGVRCWYIFSTSNGKARYAWQPAFEGNGK